MKDRGDCRRGFVCLLLAALFLPLGALASTEDRLRRAKDFFEYGEYERAREIAEELLASNVLVGDEALIDANRIAGLAHFYSDRPDRLREAERYFLQLLSVEPDYRLDPFFTPPAAVAFFDSVRDANESHLAPIREQRRRARQARLAEEEARRRFLAERARIVAEEAERAEAGAADSRYFPLVFLPFGTGQFQNGEPTKGATIAAVQVLSGVTSIVTWAMVEDLRGERGGFSRRNYGRAEALDRTKWVSALVFYAAWAYGIADAWVHYGGNEAPTKPSPTAWTPHLGVDGESVALGLGLSF